MEERISSSNISVLHTYDTIFSADSVEWCPHEPNKNTFVCANYKLTDALNSDDGKRKRIGKIQLFCLEQKDLVTHQTIDTSAILDQKWCPNMINDHSTLGTVDASNELHIYRLLSSESKLQEVMKFSNGGEDEMMLSLDWSTGKLSCNEPLIIVSDTRGKVHLIRYENGLQHDISLEGHEFEAWICAFYYWDKSVIFSGGDDSKLLTFDIRTGVDPVSTSTKHSAGVTCIHSNKEKEYVLASGSYDQNLLLWDIRSMKDPVNSIEMPGPMWRLKWDPHTHTYLLVACMLAGFHIVDTATDKRHSPTIIASYYEHSDLAYGADWSHMNQEEVNKYGEKNSIFAACSFYDHKMTVANVDIINETNVQ